MSCFVECLPSFLFSVPSYVCRDVSFNAGTERAFTGKTVDGTPHDNKRKGLYVGAVVRL